LIAIHPSIKNLGFVTKAIPDPIAWHLGDGNPDSDEGSSSDCEFEESSRGKKAGRFEQIVHTAVV
jgi:hypothetical protein